MCLQIARQSSIYNVDYHRSKLFSQIFTLTLCAGILIGISVMPCIAFIISQISLFASQKSDNCTIQFLAANYDQEHMCLMKGRLRKKANRQEFHDCCDS